MVYGSSTEAFLCLSESERCVSPCVAPTSGTRVLLQISPSTAFLLGLGLALL